MDIIQSNLNLLEFNNSLFVGKVFSLSEKDINHRITDTVNPVIWITGHLISSRNHLLNLVGVEREFAFEETFKGGYDQAKTFPSVPELKEEFDDITTKLFSALKDVSKDQWNKPLGYDLPNKGKTVGESVAFWTYHEAWHLGQIAVIRRSLNMEGVVPY